MKPLLEFVDELLGEYVRTAPRRVFCAIHKGMVIGIVAWQGCKRAMLGRIGEEGQIWQLAGQERFDVKLAIDRIWVAPGWRRKGDFYSSVILPLLRVNSQGKVAEWSKALDLGSSLSGGVGSNPTFVKLLLIKYFRSILFQKALVQVSPPSSSTTSSTQ